MVPIAKKPKGLIMKNEYDIEAKDVAFLIFAMTAIIGLSGLGVYIIDVALS